MLAGLLWGDFSGTAASVPLVLGVMRYSRGFEREADDFAIAFLRTNKISVWPLYDFLVRLAEREEHRGIATLPTSSPRTRHSSSASSTSVARPTSSQPPRAAGRICDTRRHQAGSIITEGEARR